MFNIHVCRWFNVLAYQMHVVWMCAYLRVMRSVIPTSHKFIRNRLKLIAILQSIDTWFSE